MERIIIVSSIGQLEEGMKVEFRHCCLANYRKAVVTDVKYKQKGRMIDGRPVGVFKVESLDLTCENGKKITVRESNFKNFRIFVKISK